MGMIYGPKFSNLEIEYYESHIQIIFRGSVVLMSTMKNNKRHITAFALTAIMSLMVALPAAAKSPKAKGMVNDIFVLPSNSQSFMPAERRQMPRWAEQRISYSQAKSIAMSRYPGAQYLDTFLNGNVFTVVLRLPNTKKVRVKIDAASGRIIR